MFFVGVFWWCQWCEMRERKEGVEKEREGGGGLIPTESLATFSLSDGNRSRFKLLVERRQINKEPLSRGEHLLPSACSCVVGCSPTTASLAHLSSTPLHTLHLPPPPLASPRATTAPLEKHRGLKDWGGSRKKVPHPPTHQTMRNVMRFWALLKS